MHPIQVMHTHSAIPDDDNDALAVCCCQSWFWCTKAHPEGMEADAGAEDDPLPEQKKRRKDIPILLHIMLSRKKHSIMFTLIWEQEEKLLESFRCLPLPKITLQIPDLEIHSKCM